MLSHIVLLVYEPVSYGFWFLAICVIPVIYSRFSLAPPWAGHFHCFSFPTSHGSLCYPMMPFRSSVHAVGSHVWGGCRETAFCFHLRRRPRHLSREREKRFYFLEERYAQEGPHRISIPARLGQVRIETIMPRRSDAGFSLRGYESPLWNLLQRIFMKAINNIHYSRRSSFALDSIGFTGERAPS